MSTESSRTNRPSDGNRDGHADVLLVNRESWRTGGTRMGSQKYRTGKVDRACRANSGGTTENAL
jgi:hypothetical protein